MLMKRLFHKALDDATSNASRPTSGSQSDHVLYGGSRRLKHRYEYSSTSKSAFVECHPSFLPTPEEFKALLEKVPGVTQVKWQTTKTAQKKKHRKALLRAEPARVQLDWARLCQPTRRV